MEDNQWKKNLDEVHDVLKTIHPEGFIGVREAGFWTKVGEVLWIKDADREEGRIEKDMQKEKDQIEGKFLIAAEKTQSHEVKYLLLAIKHIYLGMYDQLLQEKSSIDYLKNLCGRMLKNKKVPQAVKHKMGEHIEKVVNDWLDSLKSFQEAINAVYASAQNRSSITLGLSKLMHTHGSSFIRRRQEISLIKEALRDEKRFERDAENILAMHIKSMDALDKTLKKGDDEEAEEINDFQKAEKLLAIEWEEILNDFKDEEKEILAAVKKQDLPPRDEVQFKQLDHIIMDVILKPMIESLRKSQNQLQSIAVEVRSLAKALEAA